MIEFASNRGRLVQSASELPPPPDKITDLFLDFETTSRHKDRDSLNPWYNCWASGICVTWNDMPYSYYVPVGHTGDHNAALNLPRDPVQQWLRDVMYRSQTWVNHHVKYDCHVAQNDLGVDWLKLSNHGAGSGNLVCTIVSAKIIDSDRVFRGGYGLDALSIAWLHENIDHFGEALRPYVPKKGKQKNKDYGRVPVDIMAEYGCQDPLTNRRLYKYINANMPPESAGVAETEMKLTSVLVAMERRGMVVRPDELRLKRLSCLTEMYELERLLAAEVGFSFNPTSNKACFDVLCNHYGLPVLAWTQPKEAEDGTEEESEDGEHPGNPSFDKYALKAYEQRLGPRGDRDHQNVVKAISRYRKLSTFKGLFLETYENLAIPDPRGNGEAILHPTHNQAVRTGRMSVSKPNSQQLDSNAKAVIHPGEGYAFLSSDASQIEFRSIAHYTQDKSVIDAYIADPDVDYHQRVADMCGIKRRPAKTVNFSVAFGQGKGATVEALAADVDIVESIMQRVDELVASGQLTHDGRDACFKTLARQRGEALYERYHETFPNIKAVARQAANRCKERGYVFNIEGRRRYLPADHAHKAFNTINQATAADIIKKQMVALAAVLREINCGIEMVTQVHDELVLVGPTELIKDPRTTRDVVAILEDYHKLRVPLRFKYGTSDVNWKEASSADLSVPLEDIKLAGRLAHLRDHSLAGVVA